MSSTSSEKPSWRSNPTFPYHLSSWKAVDDRVRGGSSVSHLDAVEGGVRFWGHLDTQTLGGAGFASQSYNFDTPLSLPSSHFSGLAVKLLPRSIARLVGDEEKGSPKEPTRITIVLKTEVPEKRQDGRNEAVVSWEADFDVDEVLSGRGEDVEFNEKSKLLDSSSTPNSATYSSSSPTMSFSAADPQVRLPFPSFVPTYRGRPVEPSPDHPVPRLDPSSIVAISLMCRSDFGKQEGDFDFRIKSVEGIKRRGIGRDAEPSKLRWGAWLWALLLKFVDRARALKRAMMGSRSE